MRMWRDFSWIGVSFIVSACDAEGKVYETIEIVSESPYVDCKTGLYALHEDDCPDTDGDGFKDGDDCVPDDPDVYPGAPEQCNDEDDDCDGTIDNDPTNPATWYVDVDGDGHGDASTTVAACDMPYGYTDNATDCNDGDDAVGSIDNDQDCDGVYTEDDCDDGDPRLPIDDMDCDGIITEDDCDDNDYTLGSTWMIPTVMVSTCTRTE